MHTSENPATPQSGAQPRSRVQSVARSWWRRGPSRRLTAAATAGVLALGLGAAVAPAHAGSAPANVQRSAPAAAAPAATAPARVASASANPATIAFMKRVDRSARQRAHLRTYRAREDAYFTTSASRAWFAGLRSVRGYRAGVRGGESAHALRVLAQKVRTYRKTVIAKLTRSGLHPTGRILHTRALGNTKLYANARFACAINWDPRGENVRLQCVDAAKVRGAARQIAPFARAYDNAGAGIAFARPKISHSSAAAYADYLKATAVSYSVRGSSAEEDAGTVVEKVSHFAKAPGGNWLFVTDVDRYLSPMLPCSDWEQSSTGSRAWAGEPCWRPDPANPDLTVDDMVRPW